MITIKVPIFTGNIKVVSEKEWNKVFPDDKIEPLDNGMVHTSNGELYIWVSPTTTRGTLAHECLHAVNRILYSKGMTATISDDETQAYLLGWLFDKLYPICFKDEK
ncbi:MAG: hypothetical protein J6R99_00780 [Alphaproteobacteria bacterium]|nr:hypothetical protein [Alphaproteobacteria bacterium]